MDKMPEPNHKQNLKTAEDLWPRMRVSPLNSEVQIIRIAQAITDAENAMYDAAIARLANSS